jgi:uncharacterized small protein (DUF1192 family)
MNKTDGKLKILERDTNVKFTPEGFMEHWEKVVNNPSWLYQDHHDQLVMTNLLILNKTVEKLQEEVTRLKAELQEIKNNPEEDLFLFILSLWITSHPGQEVSTRELYIDLKAISEDKGLSFTLPDARALGVKLKQFEQELKQNYSLTSRVGTGNIRYYSFKEAGLE